MHVRSRSHSTSVRRCAPARRLGSFSLALVAATILAPLAGARAADDALYREQCAACHGASGDADTGVGRALGIPSFAGASFSRDALLALLENSKSHAGVDQDAVRAGIDSLLATLEALAAR